MTGELIASGLHFEKGLFARRYQFDDQNGAVVEHRVFISRNVSLEEWPSMSSSHLSIRILAKKCNGS
jgi:hypothetical protein